jgi:hypothetical protein
MSGLRAVDDRRQHIRAVHDDAARVAGADNVALAQARDLPAHGLDGQPEIVGDLGARERQLDRGFARACGGRLAFGGRSHHR